MNARLNELSPTIEVATKNINQSPWKVNMLSKLVSNVCVICARSLLEAFSCLIFLKTVVLKVRGQWVPDAIAQLKFSPKHKARDISQMLNVSARPLVNIEGHCFDVCSVYIRSSPAMRCVILTNVTIVRTHFVASGVSCQYTP